MITKNPDNEKELLFLVSQGDEKAFRSLFDQYHTRLLNYIFSIVKSGEVAEELVMDIFLKLWLGRDKLPDIENIDGFLFRIAYNKTIDFFRASKNNRVITDLLWEKLQHPSNDEADASLMTKEYDAKLLEALSLLSPQRRKIFNLSRELGHTHTEIAEELGISKNTVANTIVEARRFIMDHLSRHLELVVLMTLFAHFREINNFFTFQ